MGFSLILLVFLVVGCGKDHTPSEPDYYDDYIPPEPVVLIPGPADEGVKAFPTAEGYGRFTTGGRGGKVLFVTNLNDSGEGSLRAAVEQKGARTIIFRVSGNIELKSELKIKNGNLTIAGQTAPGDGICIQNYPVRIDADNVIIRFLRFRLGDKMKFEGDALCGVKQKNIIIDHCSMSWSVDEAASFYDNENFTMQWCLISESLCYSVHSKGRHGYGGIWGGKGASFHHNLLAHHWSRNPRFCGSRYHGNHEAERVDFRNNVIYNWGNNSAYGGEGGYYNIVANYFKPGPATQKQNVRSRIVNPSVPADDNKHPAIGKWYVGDNFMAGSSKVTADNWAGVHPDSGISKQSIRLEDPFPAAPVTTYTAESTFEQVVAYAGAIKPRRDIVDKRIAYEVRTGTATYGGNYGTGLGIIDTQETVGGWPILKGGTVPLDSDGDGMPDAWEVKHGLNPNAPEDRNDDFNEDGYTNLEKYLNELAGDISY
ncbi:MAG: pectate lyase [Firmicutes bacterium]|nr:pectate lyase [Bacillota bacterium]